MAKTLTLTARTALYIHINPLFQNSYSIPHSPKFRSPFAIRQNFVPHSPKSHSPFAICQNLIPHSPKMLRGRLKIPHSPNENREAAIRHTPFAIRQKFLREGAIRRWNPKGIFNITYSVQKLVNPSDPHA